MFPKYLSLSVERPRLAGEKVLPGGELHGALIYNSHFILSLPRCMHNIRIKQCMFVDMCLSECPNRSYNDAGGPAAAGRNATSNRRARQIGNADYSVPGGGEEGGTKDGGMAAAKASEGGEIASQYRSNERLAVLAKRQHRSYTKCM